MKVRGTVLKRPTAVSGGVGLVALVVVGMVWLITDNKNTTTYTAVFAPMLALITQNLFLSVQSQDQSKRLDTVEKQTNGQLAQQIQDVKDHVTQTVAEAVNPISESPIPPVNEVVPTSAYPVAAHAVPSSAPVLRVGDRLYDFSWARPTAEEVKRVGHGVIGYLSNGIPGKDMTKIEADHYRSHGLFVGLVWETAATRAAGGFAAGQHDARLAQAEAHKIGCPIHVPIFFACDFDADPAQVAAYYRGVVSILGSRSGCYGGIRVIEARLTPWLWQTSAWSGNAISKRAHLYQRRQEVHRINGTDENVVMRPIPLWAP